MLKNKRKAEEKQEKSRELEKQLVKLLWPVLVEMKQRVDRRLVKTFLGLVIAIVMHRHRNNGLLLSELGGYLLGPEHCRAGIKRISNLVHSQRWEAGVIEEFLWQRGTQRVEELWEQGERPLAIWDESVLEKPESLQAEGLCAVRSTKAVRLKRITPGYFNPPGGRPTFVPGFHWLQILEAVMNFWNGKIIRGTVAVVCASKCANGGEKDEECPPIQFERQDVKLIEEDNCPAKDKYQSNPNVGRSICAAAD